MPDTADKKRLELVLSMLCELKETTEYIKRFSIDVENSFEDFYLKMREEYIAEIQDDLVRYKNNISEIHQLGLKLTSNINEWYIFNKDSNEVKRILFPFRVLLRKKRLKREIEKINGKASEIAIENRFLLEKINGWEQQLGQRAIAKIKDNEEYRSYESLIHKKDLLVSEFLYLLPTLHINDCKCLDLDRLDTLMDKLLMAQAS